MKKTALLISALEPGYTGGGALCTLAYLQALSIIHENELIYIGPEFDKNLYFPGKIKNTIFVPKRNALSKLNTLVQLKSADRLSPFIEKTVLALNRNFEIVYINDERAGRFAALPLFKNKRKVTIFHNYRADYQKYKQNGLNPLRKLANQINVKNSNIGYDYSDFRIFLTEHDRKQYYKLIQNRHLDEKSFGYGYFGTYGEDGGLERRIENGFNITINASLGRGHNVDSILNFLEHFWPQVVDKNNLAKLTIAGRTPNFELEKAVQKVSNVSLVPNPSVEEMENIFSKTTVSVCTNTDGSGIKLRVTEALRRGIPVVCSQHCAIGYENIDPKILKVYANKDECVANLFSFFKEDIHSTVSEHCIQEYQAKLSFESGIKKLTEQLKANNIL